MNRCKPFEHDLGYVTDREDYVECKKCFIQWKMGFDGEKAKERPQTIQNKKIAKGIKEWIKSLEQESDPIAKFLILEIKRRCNLK